MKRLFVVVAFLTGCPPEETGPPQIFIETPEADATVCGDPVLVIVDVSGFELVPMQLGDQPRGSGHIDATMNGQAAQMTDETIFEIAAVADGRWLLRTELVNANHTPIDPPAFATVEFTVSDAACER